jgi:hypothetical protein
MIELLMGKATQLGTRQRPKNQGSRDPRPTSGAKLFCV